jgi:hypothetical protein
MLEGSSRAGSGSGLRTAAGFVTFFAAFVGSLGNWLLAFLALEGTTILTF